MLRQRLYSPSEFDYRVSNTYHPRFGCRVQIGRFADDDDVGNYSGLAYVSVRSGSSWSQLQKLTASDAAADGHFGSSVSFSLTFD